MLTMGFLVKSGMCICFKVIANQFLPLCHCAHDTMIGLDWLEQENFAVNIDWMCCQALHRCFKTTP